MSVALSGTPRGSGRLLLRVNIAAILTFVALSALILNPLFGPLSALVFLIAGGLLAFSKPEQSLRSLLRFWYLMILPAYCLLSVLWSQFPALSLRYAVQLAMTMGIAIIIANRVSPLRFLYCLFGIYGIGILASLLFGRVRDDIGAWIGIFGSKNAFAVVISGFILTAVTVALDRAAPRPMRLAAIVGLAVSGPLLVLAQSVGGLLFTIPAVAVALAVISSRRAKPLQRVAIAVPLALLGAALVTVVLGYKDELFNAFLYYTGKDATMTGRTDLWEYGLQAIREHPMLGLGYQAFWVQGYPPAEFLWAMFGIASRAGFNFHNTYISNAVEIGLVGVAIQVLMLYGAAFGVFLWTLRRPLPENAFFAGFLTAVVCSSFVEVSIYFQFSITSIIAICALVYAVQANGSLHASRAAGPAPAPVDDRLHSIPQASAPPPANPS